MGSTTDVSEQWAAVPTGAEPDVDLVPGQDKDQETREVAPGWATSRRGRLAVSLFLVVVLAAVLATNMPRSTLKAQIVPLVAPVLAVIGMGQNWGVFAPDPRMDSSEVIARISFVDGTTEDRTIEASRGLGEFRDYRWRKYEEQLWLSRDAQKAWLPYARWLTRADTASGHRVREVAIIRRTRASLPPGPGPDYGPWRDIQLGRVTGPNS